MRELHFPRCLLRGTESDCSSSPYFPLSQQTGFEFKQKKAIPQLEGVVVAVENAEVLLEVRDFAYALTSLASSADVACSPFSRPTERRPPLTLREKRRSVRRGFSSVGSD